MNVSDRIFKPDKDSIAMPNWPFYFLLAGEELKLKDVLTLTSFVKFSLNTYSNRILTLFPLTYLSTKRELSISNTREDPICSETSLLEATMTSPLVPVETNTLIDLNMPMLLSFGSDAIILAEAILTSLI